jgi:hypothetical protein
MDINIFIFQRIKSKMLMGIKIINSYIVYKLKHEKYLEALDCVFLKHYI